MLTVATSVPLLLLLTVDILPEVAASFMGEKLRTLTVLAIL